MPKPCNTTVAALLQKIRRIRIAKHYSQDYVARKLDITQNAYSKMESGITEITLDRAIKLAALLGTDIVELFCRESTGNTSLRVISVKSKSLRA